MGSFNNIKKKTFKNISLTYINMNKMIFFTNYIYKITKQTKNYYYLNGLQTDNKLIFKANEFELYNIVKLKDNVLYHFVDVIDKNVVFKMKKNSFTSSMIVHDLENVYVHNQSLMSNYYSSLWYLNSWKFQEQLMIHYNIQLLTNDKVKEKFKKIRNDELIAFIFTIIQKKEIESIQELGYTDIYHQLKEEAEQIYFKDKEKVLNVACPVCLSDDVDLYKGFYSCCHPVCFNCFRQWNKCARTCPICRAATQ